MMAGNRSLLGDCVRVLSGFEGCVSMNSERLITVKFLSGRRF